MKLKINLHDIGLSGRGNYAVTDLWSTTEPRTATEAELSNFSCTVRRDKTAGGGLAVFKIE